MARDLEVPRSLSVDELDKCQATPPATRRNSVTVAWFSVVRFGNLYEL